MSFKLLLVSEFELVLHVSNFSSSVLRKGTGGSAERLRFFILNLLKNYFSRLPLRDKVYRMVLLTVFGLLVWILYLSHLGTCFLNFRLTEWLLFCLDWWIVYLWFGAGPIDPV